MNRRAFLKTIPILCSAPQVCTALAYGKSNGLDELPQLFRWVSLEGGKQQLAYEDLWDPAFQTRCRITLRHFRRNRLLQRSYGTPSLGPMPRWDLTRSRLEREMDWVSFTRQLPKHAPGKQRYVRFLLNRYSHNFDRINRRYGTQANRVSDLTAHPFVKVDWQNREIFKDDQAFQQILKQQWSDISRSLTKSMERQKPHFWSEKEPPNGADADPRGRQSRFAIL